MDKLLKLDEVAELLAVSPRTVRRLAGRGLPAVRVGRILRFFRQDVERFVAGRRDA